MATGVELATAYVSLALEGSTLKKQTAAQLNGVPAEADRAGKESGKRFGGAFTASFKGAVAGIAAAFGGREIVQFFSGAVAEARDLNETLNKSSVIFGSQAKAIESWGKTAAKTLGLSKNEAIAAAAGFGDMFSQLGFGGSAAAAMSKQVVQMSADLGSFNNLPTAEVADRLSAAFRGEFDSLQALIPNINAARVEQEALAATGKKSAKDLTAAEKAAATLAIVQKDGARAAGDFARTSGGLANQQKIAAAQWTDLKASIGQGFLPVITKVVSFTNSKVIPALSSFGKAVGAWVKDNKAAFQTVGAAILAAVRTIGGALAAAVGFVTEHQDAFKTAAIVLTAVFLPAILGIIGGLIATTAAMIANAAVSVLMTAGWVAYVAIANIARTVSIAWTAAQWLLNAALTANPIGLVIVAIVALVAGLVLAWKKSETFRGIVTGAFTAVKNAALAAFNWVKANWPLLLAIITGPIGLAVLAVVKNWDRIKAGAAATKDWIVTKFTELVSFVNGLPGKISNAASGMWDGIKSAFRAAINWVIGKWNGLEFGIPGFTAFGKSHAGFSVGTPNIPMLAEGGVATRPTLAGLAEAGSPEAVVPLDRWSEFVEQNMPTKQLELSMATILALAAELARIMHAESVNTVGQVQRAAGGTRQTAGVLR